MNHKVLLQLGAELMHEFRHSGAPADKAAADYYNRKKFLGATDRRFVSDAFYYTLRHMRRIDEAILSAFDGMVAAEERYSSGFPVTAPMGSRAWVRRLPGERQAQRPKQRHFDRMVDTLRLGLAAVELGLDTPMTVAEELERAWPLLKEKNTPRAETLERLITHAAEVMKLYAQNKKGIQLDRRFSFPTWLWGMMGLGRFDEEMLALGEALNSPAPVALRINTLHVSNEEGKETLKQSGLAFRDSAISPTGVVLPGRVPSRSIPKFREGWFEIQDEGSQAISNYTAPKPGDTVVDACAGTGGKALHLAALMENRGRIIAFDEEASRLEILPRRAERAGATNIALGTKEHEAEGADVVLLDVPCSGTGTLRRSPDLRWRLSSGYLEILRQTQWQLLERWAPHVRPGGHLVYATCSILVAENEVQTDRFLAEHPEFQLAPPEKFEGPMTARGELQTLPHKHGCDGFYAARFVKQE